MKHNKQSKRRKRQPKAKSPEITQEKFDQLCDNAFEQARAEARQKEDSEHQEQMREYAQLLEDQRRETPKRDLSQIKFPHWWKDPAFIQSLTENKIPIEEQKAAMWYEAARRRPEVQKAWVEGKFMFEVNGRQEFTTWVVQNLPVPWSKLDQLESGLVEGKLAKQGIIKASYSHWSVPPEGYSTFPTNKVEQMKVSMQVLRLPQSGDSPDAAQRFVKLARQFADNGFLIVAVDRKQNQAVRAACAAIEALPATCRKADLQQEVIYYVPRNISPADEQALKQREQQGTLTDQYVEELWRKYSANPTNSFSTSWNKIAEGRERVLHKRFRKGKRGKKGTAIEGKQFNFENICRELEEFDKSGISDFVKSVRL